MVSDMKNCIGNASAHLGDSDPIRVETIANTNLSAMTDAERSQWYEFFESSPLVLRFACVRMWSQEIDEDNADKRNEQYRSDCLDPLNDHIYEDLHGNSIDNWQFASQLDALELLDRPYLLLTPSERHTLRSIIGDRCSRYYPQLYVGRWVPLMDN